MGSFLPTGMVQTPAPPVFTEMDPKELKPHPANSSIYGSYEDVTELVELIAQSGWVKPLVVTPSFRIISGHRRWKATLQLELKSVPVEVREFADELAELEALLLENASRFKTIEQKVREANAWKEVEASKAFHRQILLAGTRPNTQPDLQVNLPEGEKGQTRDLIAQRVGLRARNYEKAARVVETIDEQTSLGDSSSAQALRRVLNEQSVDAAYQIVKKPTDERAKILSNLASGEAKTTKEAFALTFLSKVSRWGTSPRKRQRAPCPKNSDAPRGKPVRARSNVLFLRKVFV
jgi:ParB family chromosome partitioning protein